MFVPGLSDSTKDNRPILPNLDGDSRVREITEASGDRGKTCSICGKWHPSSEFSYGNRENRSYCQKCNSEEKVAYTQGGSEAAQKYRDKMRANWKDT